MLVTRLWALSRWFYRRGAHRAARAVKAVNFHLHHALLPYQADVGQRVVVEHHGLGVVMHPNVTIGDDVKIWHQVTLATETLPGSNYRIYVEDGAVLGAGSIVVGRGDEDLVIGRGASVGAGAVVTRSIDSGSVVAGVPARSLGAGPRVSRAIELRDVSVAPSGLVSHSPEPD